MPLLILLSPRKLSMLDNQWRINSSTRDTLIFLLRLSTMKNLFELLIKEWKGLKVLDKVTSMTCP